MSDFSTYPSDAAIIAARQARASDDYSTLTENFPDTCYQAIDAARRLDREETICHKITRDTGDFVTCGGCKVPLD